MFEAYLFDSTTRGILAGAAVLMFYVVVRKGKSDLSGAVAVFTATNGVVIGFTLCLLSITKFTCNDIPVGQPRFYLFIGGFSALWVSCASLGRSFGLKKADDTNQ